MGSAALLEVLVQLDRLQIVRATTQLHELRRFAVAALEPSYEPLTGEAPDLGLGHRTVGCVHAMCDVVEDLMAEPRPKTRLVAWAQPLMFWLMTEYTARTGNRVDEATTAMLVAGGW